MCGDSVMAVILSQWNLRRIAIVGAISAIPFGACVQAQEVMRAPEQFYDGVMGALGLQREKPAINYRERSPLVVPRDTSLPPPQSTAVNNPNWPVDPEVKQARALAAAERDDGMTSSQRMDKNMLPLLPSEIAMGRTGSPQNNPHVSSDSIGLPTPWSALGYKGGLFSKMFGGKEEETAKFTGENPRTSLVTPPAGYQTPSPNQPYGLAKDKYKPQTTSRDTDYGKYNKW